ILFTSMVPMPAAPRRFPPAETAFATPTRRLRNRAALATLVHWRSAMLPGCPPLPQQTLHRMEVDDELGPSGRQLEAAKRGGEGEVGSPHRRRDRHDGRTE